MFYVAAQLALRTYDKTQSWYTYFDLYMSADKISTYLIFVMFDGFQFFAILQN